MDDRSEDWLEARIWNLREKQEPKKIIVKNKLRALKSGLFKVPLSLNLLLIIQYLTSEVHYQGRNG